MDSVPPAILGATLHVQQLYDLCDSIDLEKARVALASTSTRMRPVVTRGGNIEVQSLPVVAALGERTVEVAGAARLATVTARVYDLGIIALTLTVPCPSPLTWPAAIEILAALQPRPQPIHELFMQFREALRDALREAIIRPNDTVQAEDYQVFTIDTLGSGALASTLARHPLVVNAALAERRPLSASASTLVTALSYYQDDLIMLSWTGALVIEPDQVAREDALFLLEFANVQLLAFRSYDTQVERDLERIGPGIARRRRPRWWTIRATTDFLHDIHRLIGDTTELSARAENALKVTEDVYWNRVYAATLAVLRVDVWRAGLAESLDVLRRAASLLNDEAESARSTLLELLIIALIAIELVVALIGLLH